MFVRTTDLNNRFFRSGLLGYAVTLVRAASERAKPNEERLPEFTDQALVHVQQEMSAPVPIHKDVEELDLTFFFSNIRRDLGTDDAFVKKMLGKESPEELAHRLVSGTNLEDPKVREELYQGGQSAVAASTDPMVRFAASIDDDLLAVRKDYEARVDAPTRAAAERIAKARFAVYGTSVDPDATFTLRLSFGAVKGFEDAEGKFVQPYTTIGGLFERASGAPPYKLPESWLKAKGNLNLSLPMNLSTTNDIIGGNSGSPLIDKDARVVGLIFDGNIFSLGGDYGYDAKQNRSVAVDSRALHRKACRRCITSITWCMRSRRRGVKQGNSFSAGCKSRDGQIEFLFLRSARFFPAIGFSIRQFARASTSVTSSGCSLSPIQSSTAAVTISVMRVKGRWRFSRTI